MIKKLLIIAIAALSVISIQAQPIAKNYIHTVDRRPALMGIKPWNYSLAEGGIRPYTYNIVGQPQNGTITVRQETQGWNQGQGYFVFTIHNLPASFQFTVTDANGNTSQPATFTVSFPEKG